MADEPKIQIDSDWKKQAQQEKERLSAEVDQKAQAGPVAAGPSGAAAGGPAVGPEGLPPAKLDEVLALLGTQVFMYLGEMPDPVSGQAIISLPLAKHYIDLLAILEAKTKGNLDETEKKHLDQLLYEARMRYVQVASGSMPLGGEPADGAGAAR